MNLSKFSEMFDKKKTFRPKKKFQPGTMKYSLHKQAQASLNSGINLRQVTFFTFVKCWQQTKRFGNIEIFGKNAFYLATNVQVVKLPKGEDFNDWLAVHVVDFFNRCSL